MELNTQDLELDLPCTPVHDQPGPSFEGRRTEGEEAGPETAQSQGLVERLMEESQRRIETEEAQRRHEESLRQRFAEQQQQNQQQLKRFRVPNEGSSDICSQSSDGEDLSKVTKRYRPPMNVEAVVPSHPLCRIIHCGKEAQLSSTATESEPEQVIPGVFVDPRSVQKVPHISHRRITHMQCSVRSAYSQGLSRWSIFENECVCVCVQ